MSLTIIVVTGIALAALATLLVFTCWSSPCEHYRLVLTLVANSAADRGRAGDPRAV